MFMLHIFMTTSSVFVCCLLGRQGLSIFSHSKPLLLSLTSTWSNFNTCTRNCERLPSCQDLVCVYNQPGAFAFLVLCEVKTEWNSTLKTANHLLKRESGRIFDQKVHRNICKRQSASSTRNKTDFRCTHTDRHRKRKNQ